MTVTTSCSSNLFVKDTSKPSGIIRSSRSSSYSNDMDCNWSLSSNAKLELIFSRFATEYGGDYVYVYDGDSTSLPLIGQFSGRSVPAPITSSSNNLYVRFTSDSSNQYSGFVARYKGIFSTSLPTDSTLTTKKTLPVLCSVILLKHAVRKL